MAETVVDASALVDLLLANDFGQAVAKRLAKTRLHARAHVDAEVLSALGRLHRSGDLDAVDVETKLIALAAAPITRHGGDALLLGAWTRRHRLRLADALYVELAFQLDGLLVTTDRRLRDEPAVDIVSI
jgi:predicted nucleic acid-binding protein